MSEQVAVVVNCDNSVQQMMLLTGENNQIAKEAEDRFLGFCEKHDPNWKNWSPADVENMLENGYHEFTDKVGDSIAVCIHWVDETFSEGKWNES